MKIRTIRDVKGDLIAQFKSLKEKKSGKEWRKLLKSFNDWHLTDEAGHIWRNASRGMAGNEGLRMLVADMKAILKTAKDEPVKEKISPLQKRQQREQTIASSMTNLRRRRKSIGMAAK